MDKEVILKNLKDGYNCSQTVLMYFSEKYKVDLQTAAAIAKGFESGMFMAKTCGAVSGAYMVLGLAFANLTREQLQQKVNAFNEAFQSKMFSLKCEELLGVNINIGNHLQEAYDSGKIPSTCPKAVMTAIEILENMLVE